MTFSPEVGAVDPGERFAWLGRLFLPRVYDGYHELRLESIEGEEDGDTRTRFRHREAFQGLLVPLLLDEKSVSAGFEAVNRALAERTEARANAGGTTG